MIFFGGSRPRAVRMSRWGLPGSVVCRKVPAGPVQVTACRRWSSARIRFQVQDPPDGGLRDADQQQGEPAQQDMGTYPVLALVADGPQAGAPGRRSGGPAPPLPGRQLIPGRLGDHRPPVQRDLLLLVVIHAVLPSAIMAG
jgi:hypothetical protein